MCVVRASRPTRPTPRRTTTCRTVAPAPAVPWVSFPTHAAIRGPWESGTPSHRPGWAVWGGVTVMIDVGVSGPDHARRLAMPRRFMPTARPAPMTRAAITPKIAMPAAPVSGSWVMDFRFFTFAPPSAAVPSALRLVSRLKPILPFTNSILCPVPRTLPSSSLSVEVMTTWNSALVVDR